MVVGKAISEIKIGDKAEYTRTVTETDIVIFGGVSGDLNPAHFNEEYAKDTFFKGRIAHGVLIAGYISAVLGMQLPGPGTIYLAQDLKFTAPVRFGDTITASVEAIEIIEEKNIVIFETICKNQRGDIVIKGKATVKPPKK